MQSNKNMFAITTVGALLLIAFLIQFTKYLTWPSELDEIENLCYKYEVKCC